MLLSVRKRVQKGGLMTYLEKIKTIKKVLIRNGMPSDIAWGVAVEIYDVAKPSKSGHRITTVMEGLADETAKKDSWQFHLYTAWKNISHSSIDLKVLGEVHAY